MSKMSPEREARYAFDWDLGTDHLKGEAREIYDRMAPEWAAARGRPAAPVSGAPARSSPEVRARILQLIKQANPKYAKPFDKDKLSVASFIGTESWAEYGQVVLQMAILDTLLSIEELLSGGQQDATEGDPHGF